MFLPDVHKSKTPEQVENQNIIKAKQELRNHNYYYRSHLKELEIHNESDLDIQQRLKQLDEENRHLNSINNGLRSGNIELESAFRTLAHEGFEPR
jgi:uncharacterized protein (DUF3084 family)